MTTQLNYTVDAEDGVFIARCIELDIVSDGLTNPLRQNSCRLNRISTMGGNKGWQWQGTQRSSKVER